MVSIFKEDASSRRDLHVASRTSFLRPAMMTPSACARTQTRAAACGASSASPRKLQEIWNAGAYGADASPAASDDHDLTSLVVLWIAVRQRVWDLLAMDGLGKLERNRPSC